MSEQSLPHGDDPRIDRINDYSKNPEKAFVGARKWSDSGKFFLRGWDFLFRVSGHLGPTGQIPKVFPERVLGLGRLYYSGSGHSFYYSGSSALHMPGREPEKGSKWQKVFSGRINVLFRVLES